MHRFRYLITTAFVALAALGSAGAAAIAAPKDAIPAKRAAAEEAQRRIAALSDQIEPAIEAYNHAAEQLQVVRDAITLNKREITIVRSNIKRSQADLAAKLVLEFRTGEADALSAMLASGSLDDMLATIDVLKRSQNQLKNLIVTLRDARRDLSKRQHQLVRDERRAAELAAEKAARKAEITQGLAQAKSLRAGLENEIAQLEVEQTAYEAKLRREAEQRLREAQAAARAAQQNDPGIGGSGASSGGNTGGGYIPPPPADGSIGSRVIATAMSYLGVPYVWGGASRGGVDCSGLTMLSYGSVGIGLDHFTGSQWNSGSHVSRGELAPGDLVFFYPDHHHVGIYIGNGQFIHAPHTGDVVKISDLDGHGGFSGAVRPY